MNDSKRNKPQPDKLERALNTLSADNVRAPDDIRRQVLTNLSPKTDILAWLGASIWRPVYASVVPMAFGFLVGIASTLYSPVGDDGLDDLLLADNQIDFTFSDIEAFGSDE